MTQHSVAELTPQPIDLSMLPPISYVTGAFNRVLIAILKIVERHLWASIFFVVSAYVAGLIFVISSTQNFSSGTIFLVAFSPIGLPLLFTLGYTGIGAVLLAFFARNPGTRIAFAVILEVLVLAPTLVMTMSDTRALLMAGDLAVLVLIVANMIFVPLLAFHYQASLRRHAYLCLPVLAALVAFNWFESTAGLSYKKIDAEHLTVVDCQWVRPRDRSGAASGPSFMVCDVQVSYNGKERLFHGMPMPPGRANAYMEVRQALFKHYRLQ